MLLKALYAVVRAAEEAGRGDDPRTFRQVLDDKLTWTFQLARLGDLVRRGNGGACTVGVALDQERLGFRFTMHAEKGVGEARAPAARREATSVFIPAKEVLSMMGVVKESRLQQKFGFDDPTFDLVRALEAEPSRGKPPFGSARAELEELIQGRILEKPGRGWVFRSGRSEYPVTITAEGIKKVAIIDRLIVNRTLSGESIVFIDEPESFLHPAAAIRLIDILHRLVDEGVQIFMATHSYFVLKKLMLLARRHRMSVPVLSLAGRGAEEASEAADLVDGMPENPIVSAAIELYEQELDVELDG
ncbi:MAG: AAA family ATPase [Arhodomonas sp.]|nr:AAA family ATPase [Arhodomonas sp.]